MRHSIFLWICPIVLMCAVPNLQGQILHLENPVRFLALGDSYTIGQNVPAIARWPVQLRDSLMQRGYNVDTLSIIATTGWRTDNLLAAVENKGLGSLEFNLVSLLIGVNNQYQSRPFGQYVTEFPELLDSAIHYAGGEASRVFVVSIPDYAYTPFGQSAHPQQISMELDEYNAYNAYIADSTGVAYFDITPISRLGLAIPSYVAGDGLHPSAIQYTEWVKLMLDHIDSASSTIGSVDRVMQDIHIAPNPADTGTRIYLTYPGDPRTYDLRIFDLQGSCRLEASLNNGQAEVSLDGFADGMYLVQVRSVSGIISAKLCITHR